MSDSKFSMKGFIYGVLSFIFVIGILVSFMAGRTFLTAICAAFVILFFGGAKTEFAKAAAKIDTDDFLKHG